jgi:uncharacterized protein
MSISRSAASGVCVLLLSILLAPLQAAQAQTQRIAPAIKGQLGYEEKKRETSDIAVTIVVSGLSCTCARFAEDIRNVVNDLRPDGLRVLPVLGVGGLQNLNDVLFLKGIDMGVVDEDNLKLLKKRDPRLYANLEQRVQYITRLYNSELHVLARNEIKTYDDLRGKRVSFNLKDSQTEVTAEIVFDALKIEVERLNFDNDEAIKQLREGKISAMIVLTGAPQIGLARLKGDEGLHFLAMDEASLPGHDLRPILENYLPTEITHAEYPALIPEGAPVPTVANKALLVAYAWPESSPRYKRLSRFVNDFFERIYQFHDGARHPKWKEVNLAADVHGWTRFKPAGDWLAAHRSELFALGKPKGPNELTDNLRTAFDQFVVRYAASTGQKVLSAQERDALFGRFQEFLNLQAARQSAR